MASLVLGAVGAGIGAATPIGAALGWTIGSTLGSMFFSSAPDQEGPRLNDLQIQDASLGKPIPIVYGRDRIAGNIIWSKPLEEVKHEEEVGGKGGGATSTTYNYFATFALGLCEGEIFGIRRIWIDSKLVYKYTDDATTEEILASNAKIDGITVYTGSETQDPDPLIQADKGAANTPAFRGLAYLVFDRLDVGNSGRIPNITVEVIGQGSSAQKGFVSSHRYHYPDIDTDDSERTSAPFAFRDGVVHVNLVASDTSETDTESELQTYSPSWFAQVTVGGEQTNLFNPNSLENSGGFYQTGPFSTQGYNYILSGPDAERCALIDGAWIWVNGRTQIGSATTGWSIMSGRVKDSTGPGRNTTADVDLTPILEAAGATGDYLICAIGTMDFQHRDQFLYVFTSPTYTGGTYNCDTYYKLEPSGDSFTVTETGTVSNMTQATWPALSYFGYGTDAGCCVETEDYLWGSSVDDSGRAGAKLATKSGTTFTVGSSLGIFDDATYLRSAIVATDKVAVLWTTSTAQFADMYILSRAQVITPTNPALSEIVSDLCVRAGLSTSDIDVTALTDAVRGYSVPRVMSARRAIGPLMLAYHFDGAEDTNKLNFVKRGGSVAVTIPEADLGVDSEDLFVQTRQQESELPSEVIINYKDVDRDFQPGSQRSRRINTNVENVRQVDVPIALTADEAKQLAEVVHYNAWVERDKFEIQVTQEYLARNATDVIQFTENGRTRKGRIVNISYGPMMKLEMVAESGTYSSSAAAGTSEAVAQTLGIAGPTNLRLLDIPMLRNKDNDDDVYLAASGHFTGWSGCRVYKSSDAVSYSEVDALFNAVTQGYATAILADASHTVWDRTSTVTVQMTSGTLSSTTEINALKGGNPALIGNEIVHFVNATDNGNGSYTLDTFIRGRRGTDWATGTHAISDRFILLEENKMSRLEVVLNTARYFKAVSIGNYLVNASSQSFTNTGIALKPFSPTYIRGTRDGSNNLTITWLNRSRYIGGALQPLPLFEDSEQYKVEILDSPGGSVLRTISSITSKTTTYTAAQQTADGLTPGNPVYVKVYQNSGTVGYSYGKEATV